MPHQNRVTPFGTLIVTPERGMLNGNRGCLLDKHGQIRRQFRGRRWIICLLEFKGRRHPIMRPGLYTDLFFLDEATALAAGHRPCAECQRPRFNLFRETWAKANPEFTVKPHPLATEVDEILHRERIGSRNYCDSIDGLPDGTFLTNNEQNAYILFRGKSRLWTPSGYKSNAETDLSFPARILTPISIVKSLSRGYPVEVHPSAFI